MKRLIKCLLVSVILVSIFIVANYFVYKSTGRPLTAIRFDGGESAYYIGIGFTVSMYYHLAMGDDAALGVNSHFSVGISVVLFTAIFWHTVAVAFINKCIRGRMILPHEFRRLPRGMSEQVSVKKLTSIALPYLYVGIVPIPGRPRIADMPGLRQSSDVDLNPARCVP